MPKPIKNFIAYINPIIEDAPLIVLGGSDKLGKTNTSVFYIYMDTNKWETIENIIKEDDKILGVYSSEDTEINILILKNENLNSKLLNIYILDLVAYKL